MEAALYEELKKITPEEERILAGSETIEGGLYTSKRSDTNEVCSEDIQVFEAQRLLEAGKLIQVRKHTRFVHFPKHRHDYVEMIYMCSGTTHHRINGRDVWLRKGELLLLNQQAQQEIFPAGEEDIAVNFIILPEFFDYSLKMMEQEPNALREFVVNCLRYDTGEAGYLHFQVADILPIQNLVENLIWTIHNRQANKRSINQATMGLLFLQLMNHMDKLKTDTGETQGLMIAVLRYIEEHYRDGELTQLAGELHYDVPWLSREIRRRSGRTYTELVQEKRLQQAAYLLTHTSMSVLEIGLAVGYENQSYFHRLFQKQYGRTPRKYRVEEHKALEIK